MYVYKFIHNINKIIKYINSYSLHLKETRLKEKRKVHLSLHEQDGELLSTFVLAFRISRMPLPQDARSCKLRSTDSRES